MSKKTSIGQLFVDAGLIDQSKLEDCLKEQKVSGGRIGSILIEKGLITHDDFAKILCQHTGIAAVNLDTFDIQQDAAKILPEDVCRRHMLIPIARSGKVLTVAMADPTNVFAIDDVRFMTGFKLEPVISPEVAISRAIDRYYGADEKTEKLSSEALIDEIEGYINEAEAEIEIEIAEKTETDLSKDEQSVAEAPVIRMVNSILQEAVNKEASHIHLEPGERDFRVRFRIDGNLREIFSLPKRMRAPLTSRVKIIFNLDISEKRIPQDGKITLKINGKILDAMIFAFPTSHGERFLIQILDRESKVKDLDNLNFLPQDVERLKKALQLPSGIILITGPRGSGKTTTLYSVLNHLKSDELCILTAEKSIDCHLEGIGQTQVKSEIGLSYSDSLKALTQQDPDFIMIQEIQDSDIANTIAQTALDGYSILSSMDTKDAPSTLIKLLEFGIQPSLIGSAFSFILSQRLVRKICVNCKVEYSPFEGQLEDVAVLMASLNGKKGEQDPISKFYKGAGCDECGGTGYRGRIPVCEILEVSGGIREAISKDVSWMDLRKIAIADGMETLSQNALKRANAGETSLEECLRIFQETDLDLGL